MRNRTRFVRNGQAERLYRGLNSEDRAALDTALDSIGNYPAADGIRISSRDIPPGVVYTYQDEYWKISFGLSYSMTDECYDISIYAIFVK